MNRLREVRAIRRVSQFQLRLATGIHQSKLSLIENGLIEPREDERKRIAQALGVRAKVIFGADPRLKTGNNKASEA